MRMNKFGYLTIAAVLFARGWVLYAAEPDWARWRNESLFLC